jgi:hypothetical protein
LSIAAAFAADGVDVRTVGVVQHLHATIAKLNHNQMTGAVKRNSVRFVELAVACTVLTHASQVLPIAVTKNLDAMVAAAATTRLHNTTTLPSASNATLPKADLTESRGARRRCAAPAGATNGT